MNTFKDGALLIYAHQLEFNQDCKLVTPAGAVAQATTWSGGSLGRGDVEQIRRSIQDHMSSFLNTILEANPRKLGERQSAVCSLE